MDIITDYGNFSIESFSELYKTVLFSKKIDDRKELYMKTETIVSLNEDEYNCVNLRTGEYSYTASDEVVFVPRAKLTVNW